MKKCAYYPRFVVRPSVYYRALLWISYVERQGKTLKSQIIRTVRQNQKNLYSCVH